MSEIRISPRLSRIFVRFPHLPFSMLRSDDSSDDSDDKVWKAWCYSMRGEINYAIIKGKLGGFEAMFGFCHSE